MGFTDPAPTEETSHLLYQSRESLDFQPDSSGLMFRLKQRAAVRDVHRFLAGLSLPDKPSLLDFSCGDGMFTRAMQKAYPKARVAGTDLHPTPPPLLNEESYFSHAVVETKPAQWDVILCRHVLEHSYNPVTLLERLGRLLRPGGFVAIEVPRLDAAAARLFGESWEGFYVPYHPLHFTERSLQKTVGWAGLKVLKSSRAEMPLVGRSLQNALGCRYNIALFAFGVALHPLQAGIGVVTGRSSCIRMWAQKA